MKSGLITSLGSRVVYLAIISFGLVVQINAQAPSHDPSNIMRDGDRYWIFNTSMGIGVISAGNADFSDWQSETSVFGDTWPSWINDYVPDFAGQFWAPACIYMNDMYYLYYSCSTMGSSLSAIGLATSPSLNDPVWTDQGVVVYSDGSGTGTVINAIDPAIFKDDDGSVWLTYGSWFGGIANIELDATTGKPIGELNPLVGGNHLDIEGAYLLKHEVYYYLFVNRGLCCKGVNSTYYIQVGRASSVTGPYSDWQTFKETEGRFIGPGHVGYNEERLTYHVYDRDDNGSAKVMNTTMDWVDGWPVAGEVSEVYPGNQIFNGTYRIFADNSNYLLSVNNNVPVQGSNVQLSEYSQDGVDGQSWVFTNTYLNNNKVSPANYSDLVFDIYNCLPNDYSNIGLWSNWGGKCQQIYFVDLGDGSYQIKSTLTNKCLEAASIGEGMNIYQNSCDESNSNQLFNLELLEAGEPMIYSFTSQQVGNPAKNILDGSNDDESRWSAEGFPQTVIIDYGTNKSIIGTKLYTYLDRAYQFTIELDDNMEFANPYIIDRSSNTDSNQPITDNFSVVSARYARITITGASGYTGTWVSLTEFEIIEETSTGISKTDEVLDDDISIYPNPVDDLLNVKLSESLTNGSTLYVYNSLGQMVLSKMRFEGSLINIDMSNLSSGMYYCVIIKDGLLFSKKFVKE